MNITLPREQQEWLEAQVEVGVYDSIDDALSQFVSEHMDVDDMAWARALVDEGRASLEQGKGLSLAEHLAHIDDTLKKLKHR